MINTHELFDQKYLFGFNAFFVVTPEALSTRTPAVIAGNQMRLSHSSWILPVSQL
jgi:hypothetical protein